MKIRDILGIVAASFVLVTAASANTATAPRKHSIHFLAPGAHQKVNDSTGYQPPRSPGYNVLTES